MLANVYSAMRIVGSIDLAYYRMISIIFCMRFIHFGPASFESCVFVGSCAAGLYVFGAEVYGAYCGHFNTSCLYFFQLFGDVSLH